MSMLITNYISDITNQYTGAMPLYVWAVGYLGEFLLNTILIRKQSLKVFKSTYNYNVVINNLSNSIKFLAILMIAFSYKTERISMYWAILPVLVNFSMYFGLRFFSKETRLMPLAFRIAIVLYHLLENLQIVFVVAFMKNWIPKYMLIGPFYVFALLTYAVLFKTMIGRINPKLYLVICTVHFVFVTIGNYLYFTGNILAFVAPCFVMIVHLFVWCRLKHQLYNMKIRMHLIHEKILNFEPLESGERLLSLENFSRKQGKYYYYLSLRDKDNFKEKYTIDPHKLYGSFLNINPNKPYYG